MKNSRISEVDVQSNFDGHGYNEVLVITKFASIATGKVLWTYVYNKLLDATKLFCIRRASLYLGLTVVYSAHASFVEHWIIPFLEGVRYNLRKYKCFHVVAVEDCDKNVKDFGHIKCILGTIGTYWEFRSPELTPSTYLFSSLFYLPGKWKSSCQRTCKSIRLEQVLAEAIYVWHGGCVTKFHAAF